MRHGKRIEETSAQCRVNVLISLGWSRGLVALSQPKTDGKSLAEIQEDMEDDESYYVRNTIGVQRRMDECCGSC